MHTRNTHTHTAHSHVTWHTTRLSLSLSHTHTHTAHTRHGAHTHRWIPPPCLSQERVRSHSVFERCNEWFAQWGFTPEQLRQCQLLDRR